MQQQQRRVTVKTHLLAQKTALPQYEQQQQQQQVQASLPPPTLAQRAKGPFLGFTLLASATAAAWQSKRLYNKRQRELLAEFSRNMLFHLGDVPEMGATIRSFRSQLGPGKYRGQMFVSFANTMAENRPSSIDGVKHLKAVVSLMQLSDTALSQLYAMCADQLQSQPSVLSKLLFLAERATPAAARAAGLRGRFPSWSEETVGALQDAMAANLYKELCEPLPRSADPPPGAAELLLSDADARRLFDEVQDAKDEAERRAKQEAEEKARAEKLQDAIKRASETNSIPSRTEEND